MKKKNDVMVEEYSENSFETNGFGEESYENNNDNFFNEQQVTNENKKQIEYNENGFDNYSKKHKTTPFFIPTIILLSILLIVFIVFSAYTTVNGTLNEIKINVPEIVYTGEKTKVTATVNGTGILKRTIINFDTINPGIAEIESKAGKMGKQASTNIIPLTTGKATIYVNASLANNEQKKAEKEITICNRFTEKVIQNKALEIIEGKTIKIDIDLGKESICSNGLSFESESEEVATVDENGIITGIKEGTTTIAISKDNKKININVSVVSENKEIKVTDVTVDKTTISLQKGKSNTIVASIVPNDATNQNLIWSTSDEKIASVSNKGVVTGISTGTVTITVTTSDGGYKKEIKVTVTEVNNNQEENINVTNISFNKTVMKITLGKSEQLTATITPSNATDKTITWKSSNPTVATVDKNGLITALKIGRTEITATTKNNKIAKIIIYIVS